MVYVTLTTSLETFLKLKAQILFSFFGLHNLTIFEFYFICIHVTSVSSISFFCIFFQTILIKLYYILYLIHSVD